MIAATHGKRAVDNLAQFKPHIKAHEMDAEVQAFEESILFFADAFNKHGPGSQPASPISSGAVTPALTPSNSLPSSRSSSRTSSFVGNLAQIASFRRPSFLSRVSSLLAMPSIIPEGDAATFEDPIMEEEHEDIVSDWRANL